MVSLPVTIRFLTLTPREYLALAVLFLISLPAVTPRVYASDEIQYFAYLRSLWFDRDVSFENEYRHFFDSGVAATSGFHATFLEPLTPTGFRENFGTIGAALMWAPFYAVADIAIRVRRATGSEVAADGYGRPYMAAAAYGSATYAFAGLVLSISAAKRLTGPGLLPGLAVWFGTPLLFYMYAAPAFAHACSAFAVALFVSIWLHVRTRWTVPDLAALGAAAALMTMVRDQDILYALGPAVDYGLSIRKREGIALRARIAAITAGVGAFVVAYTPQLLAYWSLNGRFGPSQLVTRKMSWTAPHAIEVLTSPRHGLFAWTPLALLAVAGLVLLWIRSPRVITGHHGMAGLPAGQVRQIGGCMLLMLVLQVYVIGSVESWTVAGAFGQRRFVSATILFVVGLAALLSFLPGGAARTAALAAGVLAIWWNIGLMALFGAGLMDRQRLHLRQNAYDVFVTLPGEGPALVYRYFTDRNSFYRVR